MALTARLGALIASVLTVSAVALAEGAGPVPPLVNWSAPASHSPAGSSKIRALTDISSPVPFITTAPCRQYNSLLASPLLQAVNRAVTLTGAPCGIPAGAVAVSVNITVFNISGATGNGVFKVDTVTPPAVAWINYPPSEAQRGNAGVVALNGSGQIVVQVAQGAGQVDFIVDTNGYYASAAANQGNSFKVVNSGGVTVPAIWGETDSTSTNATGVYGVAAATTGITLGVWGRNFSNSFSVGVIGVSESSSGQTFGVYGRTNSTSNGAVGTYGEALGSGGKTYGVLGVTTSVDNDAAGVYGVDGTGTPLDTEISAGVRGDSKRGIGVVGVSQNDGIVGRLQSSSGVNLATGFLGDFRSAVWAVYGQGNIGATGTKPFLEVHPTDPNKSIRFVALEGPEPGTYFRGTDQTSHGMAVIQVPESFRLVTDPEGLTVQLTPIGAPASMYIVSQDLNQIVVRTSRDVRFHYMVNGVRQTFKEWQVIVDGGFMPESAEQKLPGYFSEEQKRRLIANGTYNSDGTVNMETAERVGWVKAWADREAQTQAAAREARRAASANQR